MIIGLAGCGGFAREAAPIAIDGARGRFPGARLVFVDRDPRQTEVNGIAVMEDSAFLRSGEDRRFNVLTADGEIRARLPTTYAALGALSSFWLFSLTLAGAGAARRDVKIDHLLLEHGIETRPFFVAMNRLPMYADRGPTPVSDRLSLSGLNLPSYSGLPDAAVEEVAGCVIDFLDNALVQTVPRF